MSRKIPGPGAKRRRALRSRFAARRQSSLPVPESLAGLSPEAADRLLQEMRRCQTRLQWQNDDLRRAQQKLAQSEARYVKLYDRAPVGYLTVDQKGIIIEANLTAAKLLEVPRETLAGQAVAQWVAHTDRAILQSYFQQLLADGEAPACELRWVRANGSTVWVQMEADVECDGGDGWVCRAVLCDISGRKQIEATDITDRRLAEQTLREWNQTLERRVAERTLELQQSEARFRQLAAASFEGIAVVENGIVLDGNAQLADLLHCKLSEMIGRPVTDFVAPESRAMVQQQLRDQREATYEFEAMRADGSTFPAEAHASMRIWANRTTRVTALRDITSVKQTAARLQAQQTELEHAQRLALVSEVSAGIIHQIGQPLCAMGANLMVAQSRIRDCPEQSCEAFNLLQAIESDIRCMRDVVIHLRSLAHPEQPTCVPLDFRQLVERVLRILRQEADNRRLLLAVQLADNLPAVCADAVQLNQVILNLVRNAFDACSASTAPDRRRVIVSSQSAGEGGVELAVRDTGCGIAPEALGALFAPFFTTKPEGLGIGLRLSRTIVEAHGGRIEGYNNPDGPGATFRVILPAHPPQ